MQHCYMPWHALWLAKEQVATDRSPYDLSPLEIKVEQEGCFSSIGQGTTNHGPTILRLREVVSFPRVPTCVRTLDLYQPIVNGKQPDAGCKPGKSSFETPS